MSLRDKRLAQNEAFFREINERLEALTPDSASDLVILCECADQDCAQRLTLQHAEYEAIRTEPTQFVVARGHAALEIEDIVDRTDRFEVVRKRGIAGEVAEYLDSSDEARPA